MIVRAVREYKFIFIVVYEYLRIINIYGPFDYTKVKTFEL